MDDGPRTPAQLRELRRSRVRDQAAAQLGMATRRELGDLGVSSPALRAELRSGRYQRVGRVTYLVDACAKRDAQLGARLEAVLEVAPSATLDGVTALSQAGLRGVEGDALVHVSVPKSSRPRRIPGVVVHETRRWRPGDVAALPGPRRTRVPVAAIRAAMWARSDREAALMLIAPVQQRLVRVEDLFEELALLRRHRRRRLIAGVLADVSGGVHSLGERDFSRLCRERGLPEPSRQVRRQRGDGVMFLDVRWDEWGVCAEIDGVHHLEVANWMDDALRQNAVTSAGDRVLRIPNIGLRVMPDRFMAQVEQALSRAGCPLRPNGSHQ